MGVPTSEVGYTPAMPRREDHEVHKGHVVALDKKKHLLTVNWRKQEKKENNYVVQLHPRTVLHLNYEVSSNFLCSYNA